MSCEDILRLMRIFAGLGVSHVRLTGGEPLTHPNILEIVKGLSQIEGLKDISLSTNGTLLSKLAQPLALVGLKRVNISLDSLKPKKFSDMTRLGNIEKVLEGIDSAIAAGINPVKLNVVVVRGINETEIPDFVQLTEEKHVHVRFIELMPMGDIGFFSKDKWVSMDEMLSLAPNLKPIPRDSWPNGVGPARYYQKPNAKGTVGFISALGCGFCSDCNRMRISSKGVLVPCLDSEIGTDLLSSMRKGASDKEIEELILETVRIKPERHQMRERMAQPLSPRTMCQIGG